MENVNPMLQYDKNRFYSPISLDDVDDETDDDEGGQLTFKPVNMF